MTDRIREQFIRDQVLIAKRQDAERAERIAAAFQKINEPDMKEEYMPPGWWIAPTMALSILFWLALIVWAFA